MSIMGPCASSHGAPRAPTCKVFYALFSFALKRHLESYRNATNAHSGTESASKRKLWDHGCVPALDVHVSTEEACAIPEQSLPNAVVLVGDRSNIEVWHFVYQ